MFTKQIVLLVTSILTLTEFGESVIELTKSGDANEYRIDCYYGLWAASRTGLGRFTPDDIDPFLCTTLFYAFGSITKNITFEPFNEVLDIEQGGYAKFTGLKQQNKKLKTSLALGGWNEGSVRFASIAADATKRSTFIINCIEYLRKHNFDGLNLDWQFPTLNDRLSYSSLIKELREGFEIEAKSRGIPRLELTITLPTLVDHITKGYDIASITKYVDGMHALTYNYYTEFEPLVNNHSPLYGVDGISDPEVNANYTIATYLASGAEKRKLVLGIPTYGKAYNLSDSNLTDLGSPAVGPGLPGEQTQSSGTLAYYEICRKIKDEDWTAKQPYPNAMGQYAYKDNQWVGYDDENINRKKGEYVANNGLGGIMFWLIEFDDHRGYCSGVQFPLIKAAKEGLLNLPKYIGNDNSKIAEIPPEPLPIVSSEMNPETNKLIKPVSTSTTTERIIPKSILHLRPTQSHENNFNDEVNDFETFDEKYNEDAKISQLLQNFIRGPDGIAKLKPNLNIEETTTPKSERLTNYRTSLPQKILSTRTNENKKTESRILNVVFNINL